MTNKPDYIPVSLYLHFPFCVRKCRYCDFLSAPAGENERQNYIDTLCREIRLLGLQTREDCAQSRKVVSLYIGGGTPSLMTPRQMEQVMEEVRAGFRMAENAECSMEVNPGTADRNSLRSYRQSGINRLSIGVQSLLDKELQMLGRIHTAETAQKCFEDAVYAEFHNLNVDLMSGLPGQKLQDWMFSLKSVAAWGPSHISAYSLQIEEGTPFYTMKLPPIPSEEEDREMYRFTGSYLREKGLPRYEISNYARPGAECIHNLGYWTGREYLGFGTGAASYWKGMRYHAPADLAVYTKAVEEGKTGLLQEDKTVLEPKDKMEEFMFLGLRLAEGISADTFAEKFGVSLESVYGEVLRRHLESGVLLRDGQRFFLSEYGFDIANTVMAEYLF